MSAAEFQQVYVDTHNVLQCLLRDGIIDEQFEQLLSLQDDSEPDFVRTVMDLFLQDSVVAMERIHGKLSQADPDFASVDQAVHQLKGSSASFGAAAITRLCMQLRDACRQRDREGALQLISAVAEARTVLEHRLVDFMTLDARRKELNAA